ncbi:MAG: right-handed parallel beta-helix repeat-containing protein [Clostridiales bacterium]|nr:right-handed parallel beta-helix repeat-containing protein [Clostridiales bacterium]
MYSLLVMTICGSAVALLLMCLRYTVLRKMPSTVYYYAWLLVLLRFALPLPGLVPTSAEKADQHVPVTAVYSEMNDQEIVHASVQKDIQADSVSEQHNVAKSVPAESAESHDVVNAAETKEMTVTGTAPKASFSIDWKSPKLWLSVWVVGAVMSMAITVFSYLKFSSGLKRNLMEPDSFTKSVYDSIPGRKPALYFSDSIRPPMMLGIFKPKIVLPKREYNEELLKNILRHELTHYRRFDILYKWGSAIILSLHWFNPIAWLIRRELNRACEMSCDEMLLRSMNKDEKQSYGNTLLLMAASTALPSAVVATTFATEKRNLKERLNQIMNYKKSPKRLLAAVLAVVLLTGCGMAAGPVSGKDKDAQTDVHASENASKQEASEFNADGGVIKVKNVDEFLAAIGPNTVIELDEGIYDLSKASDYARDSRSDYYSWDCEYSDDSIPQLVIQDVKGLTIRGAGMGKTTIAAVPREANVIVFRRCSNITVTDLTAGHTDGFDYCMGGVLFIETCNDVNIDKCGLYGCGTIGVKGLSCEKLNVTNCDIYECSSSAIDVGYCEDVLVSHCDIHDIGLKGDFDAYSLFCADFGSDLTVYNCKIHDNKSEGLLYTCEAGNVIFITNEVTKNTFISSAFYFELNGATVDGCCFEDNKCTKWYKYGAQIKAYDIDGNLLEDEQFTNMKLRDIKPETILPKSDQPAQSELDAQEVPPGTEVNVTTIDEFLSAIGSDRIIVLDGTNFDLSKASNYGGESTPFYDWEEVPDGYQLFICDVKNLTIKAKDSDPSATTFEALPRYAGVLNFRNCDNVAVEGFTAGHTKEKGICSGGVLYYDNCASIKVEKMRLYGCGDMGIDTFMSSNIDVIDTEIYECTSGAVDCLMTKGINFTDCNIHDVPSPALSFSGCTNITWNDQKLAGDELRYDVQADGTLIPIRET